VLDFVGKYLICDVKVAKGTLNLSTCDHISLTIWLWLEFSSLTNFSKTRGPCQRISQDLVRWLLYFEGFRDLFRYHVRVIVWESGPTGPCLVFLLFFLLFNFIYAYLFLSTPPFNDSIQLWFNFIVIIVSYLHYFNQYQVWNKWI